MSTTSYCEHCNRSKNALNKTIGFDILLRVEIHLQQREIKNNEKIDLETSNHIFPVKRLKKKTLSQNYLHKLQHHHRQIFYLLIL